MTTQTIMITNLNVPVIKRTDTTTQLIIDWNENDGNNVYMTINEAITEWETEWVFEGDNVEEEEMVQALYEKLQHEWNSGYARGVQFLKTNEIDYGLINAIEDLYDYTEYEFGDDLNKKTLADKLDIIFYKQAEEQFIQAIKRHELDEDFWG